jgi:hypothetical protein
MAESLAREVARLQLQVQALQEKLQERPANTPTYVTKDVFSTAGTEVGGYVQIHPSERIFRHD